MARLFAARSENPSTFRSYSRSWPQPRKPSPAGMPEFTDVAITVIADENLEGEFPTLVIAQLWVTEPPLIRKNGDEHGSVRRTPSCAAPPACRRRGFALYGPPPHWPLLPILSAIVQVDHPASILPSWTSLRKKKIPG